ncbi:hypothetical protein AM587_10004652 [Phytophthora nicotianae]|uniref:HAT C-terminal dimerisation domain-containing protein n=1 Tax=Phytophthora nicotianae TaxID=4792 RepID=A0A0W8DLW5_PHYNI|nr:hypothetical protein AM587_10004652 [Phytophthora nicotianae]
MATEWLLMLYSVPTIYSVLTNAMEDMTEFRQLILPYRNRLRRQYGSGVISCIWKQVRKLRETYEFDPTFKDRSCNRDVVQAWKLVDAKGEYTRLVSFALGLASIPPGTHTVEGDFSSLKGVKSAHRGSLSNYALEGQLQAMQYFELIPLANSKIPHRKVIPAASRHSMHLTTDPILKPILNIILYRLAK